MKPLGSVIPLCLVTALASPLGCGGEPAGPATVVVTGMVTLDGEPVSDALVNFDPAGDSAKHAQAYTDQQGRFDVSIYVDNNTMKRGMVPGRYKVSVRKMATPVGGSTLEPPKNLLPERYATPDTSDLEATITQEGPNELNLSLRS